MDTSKANPFEQNGKHLGKLTRQPQKYETTLLGRQRTGSGLTYLRRGENKASQLKRHGKHIGTGNPQIRSQQHENYIGASSQFLSQQGSQRQRTKGNPFQKDRKHLRHKERRRDGNKANQLKMIIFDTRRHKEHRMDTSKANPVEKNGKHLGKLTRRPQKYETTLLGRQRPGSRLTYLRRGENKASQLKRHGKHIGTGNPQIRSQQHENYIGASSQFLSQQGSQRQRTKGNPFKEDGKHLRPKEHRRDGTKAKSA